MSSNSTIIALSGKGGVGKTSISATIVKLLVKAFPDKKILAIDADPAVGLSTALGIEVKTTIDDIKKEIIFSVEDGQTKEAVELVMYKKIGAIVNRIPGQSVIEFIDTNGIPVLSYIETDKNLAIYDIEGKNIFNLPDDSNIVNGALKALKAMEIIKDEI